MNLGDHFMRHPMMQRITDPAPEPMGFHPGFNMGQLLGQSRGMPFANSQFQPNQNPNAAFNQQPPQPFAGSGYGGGLYGNMVRSY